MTFREATHPLATAAVVSGPTEVLLLESIYAMERTRGGEIYLPQPLPYGQVIVWTWQTAMQEVRKIAQCCVGRSGLPLPELSFSPRTAPGGSWRIMPSGWRGTSQSPLSSGSRRLTHIVFAHAEPVACFLEVLASAWPWEAAFSGAYHRQQPCSADRPNLLARNFTVAKANTVWAGDMTYIPTGEGWLYLAVVVDLFSRRIVGLVDGRGNRLGAGLPRIRHGVVQPVARSWPDLP